MSPFATLVQPRAAAACQEPRRLPTRGIIQEQVGRAWTELTTGTCVAAGGSADRHEAKSRSPSTRVAEWQRDALMASDTEASTRKRYDMAFLHRVK
jgi:hypothetical protein